MITSSLLNSLFGFSIILVSVLTVLAYLLGQFILKSESIHVKAFTTGFDFLAILLVNILFAFLATRYVSYIGSRNLQIIGFLCLAILIIVSIQKLRNFFSQHKTLFKIIWEICVFGILLFPLFVLDLSLHHYGSVKTISYVEGVAFPSFVMLLLGIYFSLKFYATVMYRTEVSSI
jgi:hypothetical protein